MKRSPASSANSAERPATNNHDNAERPVHLPSALESKRSKWAPSINEQCVASLQVSAGQPGSSSQNSAAQPAESLVLALVMQYLSVRALRGSRFARVCRSWLQARRERICEFKVLIASIARELHNDVDMFEEQATVEAFRSAPREVRERGALSSLTLKIAQVEEFMDPYDIARLRQEQKPSRWLGMAGSITSRAVRPGPLW